jgi:hypothetical protein
MFRFSFIKIREPVVLNGLVKRFHLCSTNGAFHGLILSPSFQGQFYEKIPAMTRKMVVFAQ